MMIKILSMQRVYNHGSFLQAYGLKKELEEFGTDVSFLDIEKGVDNTAIINTRSDEIEKESKYKHIFQRIIMRIKNKKQRVIFYIQAQNCLGLTDEPMSDDLCDLVVIGSDEVFNCALPSKWGFSTQLFGDVKGAHKVITYAASCGRTSYDSLTEDFRKLAKESLGNLASISCRDSNTAQFVKKLTGYEPEMHLDPVLIYPFEKEIIECDFHKPFVLIYSYDNRITNQDEVKAIKEYAKEYGFEIVCAGVFQYWCKYNVPVSSFQLLGYFRKADAVITDTFHGTVLSIKYHKKFAAIVRKSNSNKLEYLLNQFKLTNRICRNSTQIAEILDSPIRYEYVDLKISTERDRTREYLKYNLT